MSYIAKSWLTAVIMILGILFIQASYSYAETFEADIKKVDSSLVCMINNTIMGKPQIPVKVEGKTYYGCCEGCVAKLKKSHSARLAKDPVTGKEVDKATAFIMQAPDGTALYFESIETAREYAKK